MRGFSIKGSITIHNADDVETTIKFGTPDGYPKYINRRSARYFLNDTYRQLKRAVG